MLDTLATATTLPTEPQSLPSLLEFVLSSLGESALSVGLYIVVK